MLTLTAVSRPRHGARVCTSPKGNREDLLSPTWQARLCDISPCPDGAEKLRGRSPRCPRSPQPGPGYIRRVS